MHAHGHAACDPIPVAGRVNGHVFLSEERFEERPQGEFMYLKTVQITRAQSCVAQSAVIAVAKEAQISHAKQIEAKMWRWKQCMRKGACQTAPSQPHRFGRQSPGHRAASREF